MNKPVLLWPEPEGFSPAGEEILEQHFDVIKGPFTHEEFSSHLKQAEVLFLRLKHQIDEEVLTAAPNLKFIATPTTGLNHIDCEVARAKNIEIISLRGETEFLSRIYATPEHCWALLLSLLRHVPFAHDSVCAGEWERDQFKSTELNGKTIGLIGYGRVAKIVARYAMAFGMDVVVHDPNSRDVPDDIRNISLEKLAHQSDVISIHADLNESSKNLCDHNFFGHLKKCPLIINTARGEIIDERELLKALKNKTIAGAALDVLRFEYDNQNKTSSSLITYAQEHQNLIITPHVAGATKESMAKTEDFIVQKLVEAIQ